MDLSKLRAEFDHLKLKEKSKSWSDDEEIRAMRIRAKLKEEELMT